jgi:hypothetical protein
VFSEYCNEVLRHDFLTAATINLNTNTLEKSAASAYFPEDEGTNLLRNISKSLHDNTPVTYKKVNFTIIKFRFP